MTPSALCHLPAGLALLPHGKLSTVCCLSSLSLLPPPPFPLWALPEKSKSPRPVETAYSRQGPKVPAESQPDATHKHSPERAQPGSPATWSGAQRLPATPGRVSRACRSRSASSLLYPRSLGSHRAALAAPLGYGEDPCAPGEAKGPPLRLPPTPSESPRAQPSVPSGQGTRGSPGPLPRECPAWVRACHSGREFALLRAGDSKFSEESSPRRVWTRPGWETSPSPSSRDHET